MIATKLPESPRSDRELLVDSLLPLARLPETARVASDIAELSRLLELYSFRTPQLAERFLRTLSERYRYEIFALFGETGSPQRAPSSVYIRLQQLQSALLHVLVMRLCCDGVLELSPSQLRESDGLLLRAVEAQMNK